MVEHIHGGSEQRALVGLTGAPGDDLGQIGLAYRVPPPQAWVPRLSPVSHGRCSPQETVRNRHAL